MIEVEKVSVKIRIPSDEVRIVAMQPFIKLHSPATEPFRWSNDAVEVQLMAIQRTLDIACSGPVGFSANFTLFPEYAIPGVAGASVINERISTNDWSNGSIIIGGIHGLTKDEYRDLCNSLNAHVTDSNSPESIPDTKWVNCCVIWVKDSEGEVQRWVQPKIRPAWPEMGVTCNDMFCGSTIYVFDCKYEPSDYPCRFVTLICFDWVASVAGSTVRNELLEKLTSIGVPNPTPLDWVFIIQHNQGPNHESFLNSTYQFLTEATQYPFIERDKATIVHANTAVSQHPIRTGQGGFSACIFSPGAHLDCTPCRPTVCMHTSSLRDSSILGRCKDVVFREMGECIHSFAVRVPRFVTPDVTDRTYPLPQAYVHAVFDTTDPRLPGGAVPAAVKWFCDSLDGMERLSSNTLVGCHLRVHAAAIEEDIIAELRAFKGQDISTAIFWAKCSFTSSNELRDETRRVNSDLWKAEEEEALTHVLHSLTSLALAYDLVLGNSTLHGMIENNDAFVQIIAIRGDTHHDCLLHYNEHILHQETDPVLVIAYDRHNLTPTPEEYSRIDEIAGDSGLVFLDYQTLINKCRTASDSSTLKEYLDGILPRYSRII